MIEKRTQKRDLKSVNKKRDSTDVFQKRDKISE